MYLLYTNEIKLTNIHKQLIKILLSNCSLKMITKMITLMLIIKLVVCTVDIDMPEMKYLSDHLSPEHCRRLIAALHFKSYDVPNVLDSAENKVSEDISCLNLLLHWNSSEGEGKGETHEMLFRRLRQIGRDDLAEWLGRTVFHELSQDLKRSLDHPFDEFINEVESSVTSENPSPIKTQDQFAWLPFDTICWLIICSLLITTLVILIRSISSHCRRIRDKKTHKSLNRRKYEIINNSETESEDKYDDQRKDDPVLKLMGV